MGKFLSKVAFIFSSTYVSSNIDARLIQYSMKIEEKPRENWQMHENKIAPLETISHYDERFNKFHVKYCR